MIAIARIIVKHNALNFRAFYQVNNGKCPNWLWSWLLQGGN